MNRSGAPTTYNRITPDRGCGFILKRIYDLTENPNMPRGSYCKNPTKQDVYRGTKWANRPGFASLLWSAMIHDGLIESDDGLQAYKGYRGYFHIHRGDSHMHRAAGHYEKDGNYTVRYHLTAIGRGVLFDMMARVNKKAPLNTVGSVAEYDAKKDEEEKLFPLPTEEQKQWLHNWIAGLNKTQEQEHDILQKEAVHCAKLAADYAGENQKLRAEKNDLNERLKKLADRLAKLESEIVDTRFVLNSLINWGK